MTNKYKIFLTPKYILFNQIWQNFANEKFCDVY